MAITSLAARRKQQLATAAGLEPAKKEAPAFTVTVSGDIGPFKTSETLSTKQQIVLYIRTVMNEGADKPTSLSDSDIWAGLQQVDVTGLDDPADKEVSWITHLEGMEANKANPLTDEDREALRKSDVNIAYMEVLGQRADDQLEAAVVTGIEGNLDWKGSPILIMGHMKRLYGDDVLSKFPPVNSRNTGGKLNRKGERHKDEVPEGWNEPTDYYYGIVGGDKKLVRCIDFFVRAMPAVKRLETERKTVVDLSKGTVLESGTIPKQYMQYIPPESDNIQVAKLQGIADELGFAITSHVNRIALAIHLWQTDRKLTELLSEFIDWQWVNGTPEASARTTKPIQLVGISWIDHKDKKTGKVEKVRERFAQRPIALGQFIRLGKFMQPCADKDGKLNTLIALEKASRAKEPETVKAIDTKEAEILIENTDQSVKHLRAVFNYFDSKQAAIRVAMKDPNKAGELAMWLDYTAKALQAYLTPEVQAIAAAHDKRTTAASLEAAKK